MISEFNKNNTYRFLYIAKQMMIEKIASTKAKIVTIIMALSQLTLKSVTIKDRTHSSGTVPSPGFKRSGVCQSISDSFIFNLLKEKRKNLVTQYKHLTHRFMVSFVYLRQYFYLTKFN